MSRLIDRVGLLIEHSSHVKCAGKRSWRKHYNCMSIPGFGTCGLGTVVGLDKFHNVLVQVILWLECNAVLRHKHIIGA